MFGACTVYRLAQRARAAAAAVWARMRPVVDIALAAVAVVAVVYVMRGAFARHRLLAEARRDLSYVLRGRPHQPGLDEQIVQSIVDDYTRPVGRGRMMSADLRALYPRDTDDQAVLRPLTRKRPATSYERARLAADTLATRVGSGRKDGRLLEPEADVDTVEQTRRTFEAAAKVAAKLRDGARERAAAYGPRTQPAPATDRPPHTPQPGTQHTPGRTTGGVA
ncbi:hypothetical protein [Streptomyces tamarix]|uniref:hypothetical protein n=1 Tax=Streptomyces tamarix TaxID=3078565 RepID=UPI0037045716